MKGKVALGILGVAAIAGAFAYGRLKGIMGEGGTLITWVPGKAFYVVGRYPWDGEHLEHVSELAGHLEGIYDSYTYYDEIDELNDMFYGE